MQGSLFISLPSPSPALLPPPFLSPPSLPLYYIHLISYYRVLAACTPFYDLGWKEQFFQTNFKFLVDRTIKKVEKDALKRLKIPNHHILKPGLFPFSLFSLHLLIYLKYKRGESIW
jgi:hypothetical protein